MLPALQIGPLALQTPGLMLLVGLWLGLSLAERTAARHQVNPNHLYNLVFFGLIGGAISGRLLFIAIYPQSFSHWSDYLSLSPQLLDAWGVIGGGLLAALVYANRQHLALWPTLDALTPALATVLLGWHAANLASGAAFGSPADLPWAIELWGAQRHPSQLYEMLAAGLILLGVQRQGKKPLVAPGLLFLWFLAWSAGARLLLEAFRGDSTLLPGNLRLAQIVAWLILATALWLIQQKNKLRTPARQARQGD